MYLSLAFSLYLYLSLFGQVVSLHHSVSKVTRLWEHSLVVFSKFLRQILNMLSFIDAECVQLRYYPWHFYLFL